MTQFVENSPDALVLVCANPVAEQVAPSGGKIGTASATWTFAGTATGVKTVKGAASLSSTFAAVANGSAGVATANWTFTATAVAAGINAAASARWTFAGQASGTQGAGTVTGIGSGTWTFTGLATGSIPTPAFGLVPITRGVLVLGPVSSIRFRMMRAPTRDLGVLVPV